MNRKHAFSISLAVGVAAIAGTVAATKTIHLGTNGPAPSKTRSALIAQRTKALDRTEIALKKALKQRPPKLPPLPAGASAAAGSPVAATPAPPSQAQRVVYVRPAPIIRTVHRAGGTHEAEHEGASKPADGSEHGRRRLR